MDDRLVISLRRHGLTDENERKAYIGWTNSPLSKRGEALIQRRAHLQPQASIVFSSPMLRCMQTAKIWYPKAKILPVPQFKEMNFGIFEGKTYEELKTDPHYRTWLKDPFTNRPKGGESFKEFSDRVFRGWTLIYERILDQKARTVVVVTHGGVIRYLLTKFAPMRRDFFAWDVPCAGGYDFIWSSETFNKQGYCQWIKKAF